MQYSKRGLSLLVVRGSTERRTRLAENTGRKKVAKNRHLGTIAQLCRAISSQLRQSEKNLLEAAICPPDVPTIWFGYED